MSNSESDNSFCESEEFPYSLGEGDEEESEEDIDHPSQGGIQPYQDEPEPSDSDQDDAFHECIVVGVVKYLTFDYRLEYVVSTFPFFF